jgi:hypothetical protein
MSVWVLFIVMLSANKQGYEVTERGVFRTEEECFYFREDALEVKSTYIAECVRVEVEK